MFAWVTLGFAAPGVQLRSGKRPTLRHVWLGADVGADVGSAEAAVGVGLVVGGAVIAGVALWVVAVALAIDDVGVGAPVGADVVVVTAGTAHAVRMAATRARRTT